MRANRGAAGVDGVTVAVVEEYGVQRMLDELAADLRAGIYRPALVRRVEIPSLTAGSGRWVSRRCVTGCVSRQPRSFSSRSSRPTSCR